MSSAEDTVALIERTLAAIEEVEIRTGLEIARERPEEVAAGRENIAHLIGQRAIADLCDAFDLDATALIERGTSEGARRATFLLGALGIDPAQLNPNVRALVEGAFGSGIFLGLRLGLTIADARAREAGQ